MGRVEGEARWHDFLQAGSRTSREFELAWRRLRSEMVCISAMLGKQVSGPLVKVCEGSGTTGLSSRNEITAKREDLRHLAVDQCLEKHRDRLARPVTA